MHLSLHATCSMRPVLHHQASSRSKGRTQQEYERRLQEVHSQYVRRIKTLEARIAAADAASGAHRESAPATHAGGGSSSPDIVARQRRDGGAAAAGNPEWGGEQHEVGSSQSWQEQQLERQLIQRNKQIAELQQQLRVTERQVRLLQQRLQGRQRGEPEHDGGQAGSRQQQQQVAAPTPVAGDMVVAARPAAERQASPLQSPHQQQQQQQQWHQQDLEQQLRVELAAAQGALALLQRSHTELLQRSTEVAAAQQRAMLELRDEVAAQEADRWHDKVDTLEQVRGFAA